MVNFRAQQFERLPGLELSETEYSADAIKNESAPSSSVEALRPSREKGEGFLRRRRHVFWMLAPLTTAMLWLIMMAYFYVYFVTLPRQDGRWPRIGFSYSTFPFISCVGAVKLPYFRGFSGAVAVANIATFSLNFRLMRRIRIGWVWRVLKLATAINASIFLVLLSIYSVDSSSRLHLIFTSIQIVSTCLTKFVDAIETHFLTQVAPHNPYISRGKFVKRSAAAVAGRRYRVHPCCIALTVTASAVIAISGIYGCRNAVVLLSPGTGCNRLVQIAAPSEWILSGCWTIYLLAIAMEMYNMDYIREDLLLQIEKRRGFGAYESEGLLSSYRETSL